MDARASAWAAAALLAAAAGAGPSAAQAPPVSFPPSTQREALVAWLRRETDITPGQVVAITQTTVTAIVSTFPAGGGRGPRVVIRAETIDRATAAREGALSWHVSMNADCGRRQVQLGETTGYPERNLLGGRRTLRPAEPDWRPVEPGTALENAWRAACDPSFRRPLDAPAAETAETPAPAARPASAAAPAPQRAPASGLAVQVLASADEAEAYAALARVAPTLRGAQATRVEPARVNGRTWHRALVTGFADAAEAARFCEALKAAGQACFVRRGD